MTAKEYLRQAYRLDAMIESRLRELEYWRTLSTGVGGCRFEPNYNPNYPDEAGFVRCLNKIDEIERDINAKISRLVDLKMEIGNAIDKMENPDEQLLLRYRYLEKRSWDEIAYLLHVSERTVHRIHGTALLNFKVPE